ncbi:RiPP maturation radical SAM C-methyltransferase [Niallia sp. HCP3S3_B10]|uniref:RiPP maturation radical SAM C-methyltransferase n=1 Tax=Niallia sp. HCP3S3_B10 TaxID=3438944 RepID=UPI003F88A2B3
MPFASIIRPPLGLEILKNIAVEKGHNCDVINLNISFAKMMGLEFYELVAGYDSTDLIGEWIFSQHVFDKSTEDETNEFVEYITAKSRTMIHSWREKEKLLSLINAGRKTSDEFLKNIIQNIDFSKYQIVGFTNSFQQTMASIALIKQIKKIYPNQLIIMGGANCFGEMGVELINTFKDIDGVCIGEGEGAFINLLDNFSVFSESPSENIIVGFATKKGYKYIDIDNSYNLNNNSIPNFGSYFKELFQSFPEKQKETVILYEGSRGCWWGEKHQCVFCGLNANAIEYKGKLQKKIYNEMKTLIESYGEHTNTLFFTDNIMSMEYFEYILPKLKQDKIKIDMFMEVKSNLNEQQVCVLKEAGVTKIQPGIESLATNSLKLMNKGVDLLQNLRLLRLCKEYGIIPFWNIIFGFSGESSEEIQGQIDIMKKINHLQPPVAISKIRLDRFSPYFNEQKKYNIRINGPIKSYKYIYRDKGININKLAYYFDYNNDAVFENKILNEFVSQFENWKDNFIQTDLFMYQRNMDKFVCRIGESNSIYKLNEIQGKILVYARNITSIKKIIENVIKDVDCNEEDILSNIQELEKLGFIIMERNKLLTIVLQFNPYIPSENLIQNALNATSIS